MEPIHATIRGRGAAHNPPNRFEPLHVAEDFDHLDPSASADQPTKVPTEYFLDDSQSILSENDSPDIPFRYGLNPYRGCAHGCSYYFARPTHEYFNLSAGLDFETKIFVKLRAPELFRDWLARPQWRPEPIMFSGATDCYQPAERHFQLTRKCLEVALEARQPVAIVTKNALVTRDLDLLRELAARNLAQVAMSITTLDQSLSRRMEPRTSSPAAKLQALAELHAAGVPTFVIVAPVVPGLTDSEIPSILREASQAGASGASYILLRLPLTVEPLFLDWLARTYPEKKAVVESRLRAMRGGKLYESDFGARMRGRGELADQIAQLFQVFAHKYGLNRSRPALDTSQFRPPTPTSRQRWLFSE